MMPYSDHILTMGSLFDGIGGFPLAAMRCGIIPVWASEIEEFPIVKDTTPNITNSRLNNIP